jgi:hypothetical protein
MRDNFAIPNLDRLIADGQLAPYLPKGGTFGLSGRRYPKPRPRGLMPWNRKEGSFHRCLQTSLRITNNGERQEDYADWVVEERDDDYAPDDANELRLVINDLKAALARGTPCLIGSPAAPFAIDRNFPGMLAKYYPVLRPSDLNGFEVVKLYNSISFAMWQFGPSAIPNCHIVILWATLGYRS